MELTSPEQTAVIIAGSRTFGSAGTEETIIEYVDEVVAASGFTIDVVVSGCARGADTYGEQWAQRNGLPIARFPVPDTVWERHGGRAGYYRNWAMAIYADRLIALWDGSSSGTQMMIELGRDLLGPVNVFVDHYRD